MRDKPLPRNTKSSKVLFKFSIHILTTMFISQTLDRSTALLLSQCPKFLEFFEDMTLVFKEIDPVILERSSIKVKMQFASAKEV